MLNYSRLDSKNPTRYARGWHCFGLERDIKKGEITSFEAFGTKIVAYSENQKLMAEYIANGQETFFQDLKIWDTKKRVNNPILCSGDGPVYQLREWYDQFYVDRANVPASIQEKKVFVSRHRADTEDWIKQVHNCDINGKPLSGGSKSTEKLVSIEMI